MSKIKFITVTSLSKITDSCANNGNNLIGNENLIKERDGHTMISANSIRHNLRKTYESVYEFEKGEYMSVPLTTSDMKELTKKKTFDVNEIIKYDLRTNLFGNMIVSENKSQNQLKRNSVIEVTPAISVKPSTYYSDYRSTYSRKSNNNNDLFSTQVSIADDMIFNFFIRANEILRESIYTEAKVGDGFILKKESVDYNKGNKREKQTIALLKAIQNLNGFAKQNTNLINATPQKVLIVLHYNSPSTNFINFFKQDEVTKTNLLKELEYLESEKEISYFLGDNESDAPVFEAFKNAIAHINKVGIE